jgi:hypothetical protein
VHTHNSPPVILGNKEKILLYQAINFNQRTIKWIKDSGRSSSRYQLQIIHLLLSCSIFPILVKYLALGPLKGKLIEGEDRPYNAFAHPLSFFFIRSSYFAAVR